MDNVTKYFRTHHLPWSEAIADDDIVTKTPFSENDDVVVTIKMDGECLISTTPILMYDGTKKQISAIKEGDVVVGMINEMVVPSTVTKTYFNGTTTDWLYIKFEDLSGKKYKKLICTPSHRLFSNGEYINAGSLKEGDILTHFSNITECSDIQKQVLLGKLLGDGSFCGKNKNIIQYTHKIEHIEYSQYINSILTNIYSNSCIDDNKNSFSGNRKYKSWTKTSSTIKHFYDLMVVNGKKTFPAKLIDEVTPLTLAVLYMDDGNINTGNISPRMHISTCGFDAESCENIIKVFNKYNIKTTLTNSDGYNYINISAYSVDDFCDLICEFIPPIMQYKLPVKYRGRKIYPLVNHYATVKNITREVKVIDVIKASNNLFTGKYDIETTTHNYFANGVLVHNCTSLYPSGRCHARSIDSANHPSRNYVKAYWRERAHLLPHGWRVCGENLYAKHSIHYTDLKAYLYVFSIWTEHNTCLSWEETKEWCELMDLVHVPVIYEGKYDENAIKNAFKPHKDTHEGYVIRSTNTFHYDDANKNLAKYVRKNHVQCGEHWMFQEIIPNILEK